MYAKWHVVQLVCIKIHAPNNPFQGLFTKTFSITEKTIPNDSIPFWDSLNVFVLLVRCIANERIAVCDFRWPVNVALLPYLVATAPYLVRWAARVVLLLKTKQCTSHSSVLQFSGSFFCIVRICHGYQQDLSLILCIDFLTIYFLFLQIIYSSHCMFHFTWMDDLGTSLKTLYWY